MVSQQYSLANFKLISNLIQHIFHSDWNDYEKEMLKQKKSTSDPNNDQDLDDDIDTKNNKSKSNQYTAVDNPPSPKLNPIKINNRRICLKDPVNDDDDLQSKNILQQVDN